MTRPVIIIKVAPRQKVMCGRIGQSLVDALRESKAVIEQAKYDSPDSWTWEGIRDLLILKGWFEPEWANCEVTV